MRRLTKAAASSLALLLVLAACSQHPFGRGQESTTSAADEDSGYDVYVTNETTGSLSIFDGDTGLVKATVPLSSRPRGLRVGLDGRTLFIALTGAARSAPLLPLLPRPGADPEAAGIALFDIVERRVVRTLKGVPDPGQITLGGDGKVYVASEEASALFVLDPESGRILDQVPVGASPKGVALSPDGRWIYVTSEAENKATVIDTVSFAVVKQILVGIRPGAVAFSADSSRAYIAGEGDRSIVVVDTATREIVNKLVLPDQADLAMDVVVAPRGDRLYVSTGPGGHVLSLGTDSMAGFSVVRTGGSPQGMALSPDGNRLYAADGGSNNLAVINTATMRLINKVAAGGGAWGVVVAASVD
jgi:YVTN family beta-propeller protein